MKNLGMLSGFIFLAYVSACAAAADSFKLVKQDGAISLYERELVYGGEDVREIKVNFTVRTDFKTMIHTLQDAKKGLQWNVNTTEYQVVATGSKSWIGYMKYRLPWPFDDQDCCLQYCVADMNERHAEVVFFSTANKDFPEHKGISRITGIKGSWEMAQGSNGYIFITYTIVSNKSLNIPRCISDAALHNNLFKTVMIFKNILEKD